MQKDYKKSSPETFAPEAVLDKAARILKTRYPDALFAVAAGSILRGQGFPHSDLDLTVIHAQLPHAYRESFMFEDLPVEAFLHDFETIQFFIDEDHADSNMAMISMLSEGIILPAATNLSAQLQAHARDVMAKERPKPAGESFEAERYSASDLLDDLRDPRPADEMRATLYALYPKLARMRLLTLGKFSGSGKHLARKLKAADPAFASKLDSVMAAGHGTGLTPSDIAVIEDLLQQSGGYLFDGYRRPAPATKRVTARWKREDAV